MKKDGVYDQISDNFIKGDIVTSLDQIVQMAKDRESIYVVNWGRMSPAAFIVGMQFKQVHSWLENGWFYSTIRKPKFTVGDLWDAASNSVEGGKAMNILMKDILEKAGEKKYNESNE